MVGRPRSFDTSTALDRIVEAFWDRGFAGTSIDDLQARIGVKRGSFYAAFGDKESAWRTALDRYVGTVTAKAVAILESSGPAPQRIAEFIRFVGRFLAENPGRGCMFLSAASQNLIVGEATSGHMERLEEALFASIRQVAPSPVDAYVVSVVLGMNAMARASLPPATILAASDLAAEAAIAMMSAGKASRPHARRRPGGTTVRDRARSS